MTSFKTLAAAALLSAMTATPVFAQAAIQEPGLFAFYHPNLDVLNGGAPTPGYRLQSAPAEATQAYAARESGLASACAHYRSYPAWFEAMPAGAIPVSNIAQKITGIKSSNTSR